MRRFPRSIEYRGYKINKTSFNWCVKGDDIRPEIVESIQEGKDFVDRWLSEKVEKVKTVNKLDELEEALL